MPILLRSIAAASLAAALASSVSAASAPPVTPQPAPPGPVAVAMTSMAQELSAASPASMPLQQRLDALSTFRHTPATAARLEKIYGSTLPWTISRLPASAGNANYRVVLSPLNFKDADGSSTEWAAFPVDIAVGADGRSTTFKGNWPQLTNADKTVRISMRDVTLAGQQQRSADNLWFGNVTFDIASVAFDPVAGGSRVAIEGIHGDTHVTEQKEGVEVGYRLGVRRLGFGAEGIDNFKFATRLTGIDRKALLEVQALAEAQPPADAAATPAQQKAALMPMLKTMVRCAVRSGTALEIDELSASFHGQTVRANGRVSLDGAVEADADSAPALLKKLVLKLHVTAPMALLREVSNVLAEIQVKAKNNGAANPREVAQLAGTMNDIVLGKLVSSGFVRVEGDTLVSDIEFNARQGGLRVNGKATELPNLQRGSPTPPPEQYMPARRIDDRCRLPDYPQDLIKADAPLFLLMRLKVKADGSVQEVTLAIPSPRPDYDKAALAAAARCVYIPALRNGKPVDTQTAWRVYREPGTTHP